MVNATNIFKIENEAREIFNTCKTKLDIKHSLDVIYETLQREAFIRCAELNKQDSQSQTQEVMQKHIECLETELKDLKTELKITREYLHNNGLEWDLLSYATRKEMAGEQCST